MSDLQRRYRQVQVRVEMECPRTLVAYVGGFLAERPRGQAHEPGRNMTRVVVHDFSGHPFQAQLARHLASRAGFDVTHVFCNSFQTPHGDIGRVGHQYRSIGIELRRPFAKYSAAKRAVQEIEYAWRLARVVGSIRPSVVVSANTPLLAGLVFQVAMRLRRVPVIFWMQDVYSDAMGAHLRQQGGLVRRALARVMTGVERWIARTSVRVVAISSDFCAVLDQWGVAADSIDVVENWAPLDEVVVGQRPNSWSESHHVDDDTTVLLYAGTLGLKHEPSLLLALGNEFSDDPDVRVIVASEGIGASWLHDEMLAGKRCVELIPFQPYEDLPSMLATADVLLVLLEPDAGAYSVPSKVLTYHCAGRAVLGAMPAGNLASTIIANNESGIVVEPGDAAAFIDAAHRLVDDPSLRGRMGRAARSYAEATFDIDAITDRFTLMIQETTGVGSGC